MAVRATYTREDFRYNHNRHVQGFWGKFKFKITPTTTTSEFFFFLKFMLKMLIAEILLA